jgi:hypothetical protein
MPFRMASHLATGHYAFYEAQLQIWENGGGTIYFPAGNYVFHETLQVFMVGGIIRGEHAKTTTITIQPLSTLIRSNGKYRDGMIVHNAATAQLQGAGFPYSYPIPATISPVPTQQHLHSHTSINSCHNWRRHCDRKYYPTVQCTNKRKQFYNGLWAWHSTTQGYLLYPRLCSVGV